jgi:hypothetical protein
MATPKYSFQLRHPLKKGRGGLSPREGEHLSLYFNLPSLKEGLKKACERPNRWGGIKVEVIDRESPSEETDVVEIRRYRCVESASGKVRPVPTTTRQKRRK